MKKYAPFIIVLIAIIVGGAYYYFKPASSIQSQVEKYQNADTGFSFEYRTGKDGYRLIDQSVEAKSASPVVVSLVTLLRESDGVFLDDPQNAPTEQPPVITVIVSENPNAYSVQQWIEAESGLQNLDFLFESAQKITIGGREGIILNNEGPYPSRTAVVSSDKYIYVFIGGYSDMESDIYKDFDEMLLGSVTIN